MDDKQLKDILSETRIKADERLKHRIMHQITYEKNLTPSIIPSTSTSVSNLFFILGLMYSLIMVLATYFYLKLKINPLDSTTFITSATLISLVSSSYWLLTVYEDYRKTSKSNS